MPTRGLGKKVVEMANGKRGRETGECAFFLIKSDVRKSSMEIAERIARLPGVEEVCFTAGKYSFLARLSAAEEKLDGLQKRLLGHAGILEVERLNAPIVMRR